MQWILYIFVKLLLFSLQCLPLTLVVRLGRLFGWLAWLFDKRHRHMAAKNIKQAIGADMDDAEITALVKENFKRIGENFSCAVKTLSMDDERIKDVLVVEGVEHFRERDDEGNLMSRVVGIGHFGNFEIYSRLADNFNEARGATTYRGLKQPLLNRLLTTVRNQSRVTYFERRSEAAELREFMARGGAIVGLLADQSAGVKGAQVEMFGRPCSASTAPALFALRYKCALHTAICFRTAPGRWKIEIEPEIPTHVDGKARPIEDMTEDMQKRFEAAVRRDPANWFWVHNRWKHPGRPRKEGKAS
ncbi:hypothetical protein N9B94_02655 [Verrucomicrobia bacterium]|nr:hypothetical protein [Verrucomicrobiota bacterium]